jgi:K+/H+ antiporter YhaU regulatory subunit KhtT
VVLGEGVELHELPVPQSLVGTSLGEAATRARTGLNVIAIQHRGGLIPTPERRRSWKKAAAC